MTIFRKGEGTRYTPPGHDNSVYALKMFNPSTGCDAYDIHITTFAAGSGMEEEVHPLSDHVFHVLEGVLEVQDGNKSVTLLKTGDTVRIPAGEYHRVSNPGPVDGVFFAMTSPPVK